MIGRSPSTPAQLLLQVNDRSEGCLACADSFVQRGHSDVTIVTMEPDDTDTVQFLTGLDQGRYLLRFYSRAAVPVINVDKDAHRFAGLGKALVEVNCR